MKAKLVASRPAGDWIHEINRALALRGGSERRLLSRNQKDLGKKFPEIFDVIAGLDAEDALWHSTIKADHLFRHCKDSDLGHERPSIIFCAFDLIQLKGEDLRDSPITKPPANAPIFDQLHQRHRRALGEGQESRPRGVN
jgi:ATP-dependent DNA ligase